MAEEKFKTRLWIPVLASQLAFLCVYFFTYWWYWHPQSWKELIRDMGYGGEVIWFFIIPFYGCFIVLIWYIIDVIMLIWKNPDDRVRLAVRSAIAFVPLLIIPVRIVFFEWYNI